MSVSAERNGPRLLSEPHLAIRTVGMPTGPKLRDGLGKAAIVLEFGDPPRAGRPRLGQGVADVNRNLERGAAPAA